MKWEEIGKISDQALNLPAEKMLAALAEQYNSSVLGSLVKGIVHNLNGSLQILSMRIELLQRLLAQNRGEAGPAAREQAEQCLEQVERFRGIIEILMRRTAHDEQEGLQPIHFHEVFDECLTILYHNLFFKHQVEVVRKYTPALPPFRGSYSDLSLGIWSLLQNAVEAMEKSASRVLTVGTDAEGGRIRLTIQDTGCGISEEIQNRLFEPFFSTKKGKHLGIGLFLTRRLLGPYGASFEVLSREGGTVFRIYLPASAGRGN